MQASFLSELRWWEHPDFADSNLLRAAEFVAADLFEPALRSRMPIGSQVAELVDNEDLRERTRSLLLGEPSGRLLLPSAEQLLERLSEFEGRLQALEVQPEPGTR